MGIEIKEAGNYRYIDQGEGEALVLLHGLFGALSNWGSVVNKFGQRYRIIVPMMPIYDMPLRKAGLETLVKFIEGFVEMMDLDKFTVIGNSLGGHVGLMYTLKHPERVKAMALTGSSGLFENALGGSFPKRGSYEYIKERVEYTFFDPKVATKEYVDEVFNITKSIPKCMNIVAIAKSAQRHNLSKEIPNITCPTLLIWGLNDTITPPAVAHEFNHLLPNSTLRFIDKCCHAPMMERPDDFNSHLDEFLEKTL
ncbi:alpha/beta hydrolase [Fulvitalea axinellae]|uniref:Alpha/beta hydrolase n=1 Tax=Fulvitalea axinellae TaxID=1182444 RepID=A0AAU9CI89_9BACT|nr:alpha/beta hydrolase [Fulvitalea axinellae]